MLKQRKRKIATAAASAGKSGRSGGRKVNVKERAQIWSRKIKIKNVKCKSEAETAFRLKAVLSPSFCNF